jgi:hypothetical protein
MVTKYVSRTRPSESIEVIVRGNVIARVTLEVDRAVAARKRLKALRAKARVGDVLSPSGERWNAVDGCC